MDHTEIADKIKGCLFGGAAGDALGYTVEFLPREAILREFGERGITSYVLTDGDAQISDDTQMTLYTANGMLCALAHGVSLFEYPDYIYRSYRDWYDTQKELPDTHTSWITFFRELHAWRAPGGTCLSALAQGVGGAIGFPLNDSKGCGGVMRAAPAGLFFAGSNVSLYESDLIGAQSAALTHGHELGYLPAAALAHIVRLLAEGDALHHAISDSISAIKEIFPKAKHLDEFVSIMDLAVELAASDVPDTKAIERLGEGWVGEEALAIAVYCALRYKKDFEGALIASVNHNGDSDSTGSVTGNILGAYLGYDRIPPKFKEKLELSALIGTIADDLFLKEQSPAFRQRYLR